MSYSAGQKAGHDWSARHFLCERRWPGGRARPIRELIGTDGEQVRRIRSLPDYIAFQEFDSPGTADAIISEVQRGPERPPGLQGYSSVEDEPVVAILRTDDGAEPAWAAFGDDQLQSANLAMPAIPESDREAPTLRLAGGATLAWNDRYWVVQAALEQKGETFLTRRRNLNLLDHIEDWSLQATVGTGSAHDELYLTDRERPGVSDVRVGPHRMETAFALDEVVYESYSDEPGWQPWFVLQFDRDLLCVPKAWRTFWMTIELNPPVDAEQ